MAAGVKFTGEWDKWAATIDPRKFEQRLQREIRKATTKNALLVRREIRSRIAREQYARNAPLTLAIKYPKSKALVDGADLFGAIAHEVLNAFRAFVGLNRKSAGAEAVNIGIVLHEGAIVPKHGDVTQAMRAAVFAKAGENELGSTILDETMEPGAPPRRKWIIPSRPFIRAVIEDPAIQRQCRRNWSEAARRAVFGAA